jgi:hypothetical protein
MRVESSVLSISWIPSEAIPAVANLPFHLGIAHYDDPPPERVADVVALREADRFRFANELRAWVETDGERITGAGQDGEVHMGSTHLRFGSRDVVFDGVTYPTLRPEPEVAHDRVRFQQTVGGRTGAAIPRPVRHKPFLQIIAPPVWTTLALTMHADGRVERELVGASAFPRHWVYDGEGELISKSGLLEPIAWAGEVLEGETPWGSGDRSPVLAEAGSALEHQLSAVIMRGGARPAIRRVAEGRTLVEQGEPGASVFLILDGMLTVEVDGQPLAELGPGAVVGERARLEGGVRTSTLRAKTRVKAAEVPAHQLDPALLAELRQGHVREDQGSR